MSRVREIISKDAIAARVAEIGKAVERDYAGKRPILVCILTGAMVFFSDLARNIDLDMRFDTMAVSSYGMGRKSSGVVNIVKDMTCDIKGEDVIIVEDIIDSGLTMKTLTKLLKGRGAASVKVCAFLDKPAGRKTDFDADYTGFTVEDVIIVGYGLDCSGKYRYLPYVGVLEED